VARRRRKVDFALDIAPVNLIDLVLILLIFFITTTTFLNLKLIELTLPVSDAVPLESDTKATVISIDSEGALFVDKAPVTMEALPELLKTRLAEQKEPEVLIAADALSRHETFVEVLAAVKSQKIEKVGIVTDLPRP